PASDMGYNLLRLLIWGLTGVVVGWRINSSLWEGVVGFGLLLAFAYAFSWVMAFVGLLVPSVEVINNASFMVIFPLTFIANTFVPSENLPGVLRAFAEWNPISALTQAVRDLFGNIPSGAPDPTVWPLQNPVIYTLIWAAVIITIFAPLAVFRYQKAVKKG
ncbi:MAG: ABC transporter permease, partial [Actinomycetia bacterium]|nr:ABC transporter permease [Actinomycetes bacterium]